MEILAAFRQVLVVLAFIKHIRTRWYFISKTKIESGHVLEMSNCSIIYINFNTKCVHIVESNGGPIS